MLRNLIANKYIYNSVDSFDLLIILSGNIKGLIFFKKKLINEFKDISKIDTRWNNHFILDSDIVKYDVSNYRARR